MQNEPSNNAQDQKDLTGLVLQESGPASGLSHSSPPPLNTGMGSIEQPEQADHSPLFYMQEDDLPLNLPLVDEQLGRSAPFVLPFQHSAPLPRVDHMGTPFIQGQQAAARSTPLAPPTSQKQKSARSLKLIKIVLIASIVLVTIIGASLVVLGQSTSPANLPQGEGGPINGNGKTSSVIQPSPTVASSHKATPTTISSTSPSPAPQTTDGTASNALPSVQLLNQMGWTQAGLSQGDAIEALRTALTFTDREMSFDYRNIGTPTQHSGTLTASLFLLTPGGQIRFAHNDKRAINNTLYNQIADEKLIQQVMNAQPTLIRFQAMSIQGQSLLFAWVGVSFSLFQSRQDANNGNRVDGFEADPTSGQPIQNMMDVVLVRQSPQNQGPNAPMGGTGWIVNTYALNTTPVPLVATNPSV